MDIYIKGGSPREGKGSRSARVRRLVDFFLGMLNKEIPLLRIRCRGKEDVDIRRYVKMQPKFISEAL